MSFQNKALVIENGMLIRVSHALYFLAITSCLEQRTKGSNNQLKLNSLLFSSENSQLVVDC